MMHWAQKIAITKEAHEAGRWMRERKDFLAIDEEFLSNELARIRQVFDDQTFSNTKYR